MTLIQPVTELNPPVTKFDLAAALSRTEHEHNRRHPEMQGLFSAKRGVCTGSHATPAKSPVRNYRAINRSNRKRWLAFVDLEGVPQSLDCSELLRPSWSCTILPTCCGRCPALR
jgi:hypothetical protein